MAENSEPQQPSQASAPPAEAGEPRVSGLPDLETREDVIPLVDLFYTKVQADSVIGPVFNDIVKVDWEKHLPTMYGFWQTVLFREVNYRGNLIGIHAALLAQTTMEWPRFERWLQLFTEAVDTLYAGERAELIKRYAEDMANVLYSRINGVQDRRFVGRFPLRVQGSAKGEGPSASSVS